MIRRSPTLLARSQEEPTYLIELTSRIAVSSRFQAARAVTLVAFELPDPANLSLPVTADNSSLQRETPACDSNGGH